ncbi:MAG TPA: hypothetical protein VHL52_02980 [Acidimicrobiia bacterium]|nr:hypothetical protein [Acidimicrobiia bacterium]
MELRKKVAIGLVALMPLSVAACSDEDDDGAVTDEEVGEIDESLEEGAQDLQEEIEEGADEADDG